MSILAVGHDGSRHGEVTALVASLGAIDSLDWPADSSLGIAVAHKMGTGRVNFGKLKLNAGSKVNVHLVSVPRLGRERGRLHEKGGTMIRTIGGLFG